MNALIEGWGVPDQGELVERPRIQVAIGRGGDRACLAVGASGCGKSSAVAQYVRASSRPGIWIDAAGMSLEGSQIVLEAARLLSGRSSARPGLGSCEDLEPVAIVDELLTIAATGGCGDGFLLVIDDLGPLSESAAQTLRTMGRVLHAASSRLLVTARDCSMWPPDLICDFTIVDSVELALSLGEASGLLSATDLSHLSPQLTDLHEASGGHVAFFSVLSRHVDEYGLATPLDRSIGLEAWIHRAISVHLDESQTIAVAAASLLRTGSRDDMEAMGIEHGLVALKLAALQLPLVHVRRESLESASFRVHDLVDGFCADHGLQDRITDETWSTAIRLLTRRGDLARAIELLVRRKRVENTLEWLRLNGEAAFGLGLYRPTNCLMGQIPVGDIMGKPRLLLLWSALCAELGLTEDALAKARAAKALAEHCGDTDTAHRSVGQMLVHLRRLEMTLEADHLAAEIIEAGIETYDQLLVAEALLCIGHNRIIAGDFQGARAPLERAEAIASESIDGDWLAHSVRHVRGLLSALGEGDFVSSSRRLAPLIESPFQSLITRVMVRGNVAICLVEFGRLSRAESLARATVRDARDNDLPVYEGSYLQVLGSIVCGVGKASEGIRLVRQGIALSVSAHDETGADQARVYLAVVLRAAGFLDESLTEAERAFERLAIADAMHFRRLAALEVAASLLALGDPAAARAWTESVALEGFSGNDYHALRADLILAEIERAAGDTTGAVERLRARRDYILSENPNWQIAMYARAFPALLGLVAAAIAPEPVPAHLLRMILPEYSEQCLLAARDTLADAEWRDLGERLVGNDEFEAYLKRDGLPLCHVRLFGGLELSIGGRAVRERDWKKRKARLLFAMLAIRRGQDVPRDQLFEYLWPEMDVERAKNNLYVVWSTMKAALVGEADKGAPCPYIETVGGVCRTVRDAVRTDVDDLEQALAVAREAEKTDKASEALRAYEHIADLYRGDLLPGDVYDDWFATLREHYRSSFVDAMLRAAELLMRADDPGNALVFTRRAIQCDPFREDLYQSALRCQIAAGQRSSAIDTYFQCRDNLSEELGLDPSAETRALYDQILAMEDRPRVTPLDPVL